jgi:general secretion pathway protein D
MASRFRGSVFASVLAVLLLGPSAASATPLLSIQPPVTNVNVGDVFSLDVSITGADDLFAFDVELFFDPGILRALDLVPATFLGTTAGVDVDSFSPFIDNGAGEAAGAQSRLVFPGVSGDGRLFSVQFRAIGVGSTEVGFDVGCDALDPFCSGLRNSNDEPLSFDVASGLVNVAGSIPEPASTLTLGLGAVAVLARRRRTPDAA